MEQDSIQRSVNGAVTSGNTAVVFDTPARQLINGEGVIFAGHSTEYVISACTSTGFTVTPALTSNIADDEKLTRVDPFRLVEFDDVRDELLPGKNDNDPDVVRLYKLALRARQFLEEKTENVFKSRSIVEVLSNDDYCKTELMLKYRPAISVESVVVQYVGEATSETLDSSLYSLNTELGLIYRPAGWPVGVDHLTVTYTAGYSTIEFGDQQNFLQLVQIMHSLSPKGHDALVLASNSKLEKSFRSFDDLDKWMMTNFKRPRLRI